MISDMPDGGEVVVGLPTCVSGEDSVFPGERGKTMPPTSFSSFNLNLF